MVAGFDDKDDDNDADKNERSKIIVSIPTEHCKSTRPIRCRVCRRIGFLPNDILSISKGMRVHLYEYKVASSTILLEKVFNQVEESNLKHYQM
jgi:hypothetical protein